MGTPSLSLCTSISTNKQQTYLFANQCDLEIYCSPFGVAAIYVNIINSDIIGVGSTMGKLTGKTKGRLYYNNGEDFKNKKFKIHGIIDDKSMLRIDFFKIFQNETDDSFLGKDIKEQQQKKSNDLNGNNDAGESSGNVSSAGSSHHEQYSSAKQSMDSPVLHNFGNDTFHKENNSESTENNSKLNNKETEASDVLEIPDIIFKGICPECRPTNPDPFIGIFSFENKTGKSD